VVNQNNDEYYICVLARLFGYLISWFQLSGLRKTKKYPRTPGLNRDSNCGLSTKGTQLHISTKHSLTYFRPIHEVSTFSIYSESVVALMSCTNYER